MIVELIAYTQWVNHRAWERAGWKSEDQDKSFDITMTADKLAEFAGRLCYQSWDRPNPATATNAGYLANILRQEHFSVLEHASATFYVAGVSRSLSHELVRHRHLSFSQVSQRYVDEARANFIIPPALDERVKYEAGRQDDETAQDWSTLTEDVQQWYTIFVVRLMDAGLSRKQARQAARSVLPNATETKFVVTGNMRAWRDVIKKRISPAADEEIQQLARHLLTYLREIAPSTFQDTGDWM